MRTFVIISVLGFLSPIIGMATQIEIKSTNRQAIRSQPKRIITAPIRVVNHTSEVREFLSSILFPDGWKPILEDQPFTLNPGDGSIRLVSFFIPQATLAGTYDIDYSIKSKRDANLRKNHIITVRVLPSRNLQVKLVKAPIYVIAGHDYRASFEVLNGGNISDSVSVESGDDGTLPIRLDEAQFRLAPGESRKITAIVQTNGKIRLLQHHLKITATTVGHPEIRTTAKSTTEVINVGSRPPGRYHNVPISATLRYVNQRGREFRSGFQAELYGSGSLDAGNLRQINFLLRGPDVFEKSIFGEHDEYFLRYGTSDYEVRLGDHVYALSPLTENYRYGRGIQAKMTLHKFDVAAYRMKTRFFRPEQQTAAKLSYFLRKNYRIGVNFLKKNIMEGETVNLLSLDSKFQPTDNTDVELEYGFGKKGRETDLGYRLKISGRQPRASYFFNMIHAGSAFLGYFHNTDFVSAGLAFSLTSKLSFNTSLGWERNDSQVVSLVKQVRLNRYYQFGFNYRFERNTTVLFNWGKTYREDPQDNMRLKERETTVRLGMAQSSQKYNFYVSADIGVKKNQPSEESTRFERLSTSINFLPTSEFSFRAYLNYDNNRNLLREDTRNLTIGVNALFKVAHSTHANLNIQTNNLNVLGSHLQSRQLKQRDLFELRLRHRLPNKSSLSAIGRHISYRGVENLKDTALLFEYTAPFHLPVSRKKIGGIVKGHVFDEETNASIPNVIVRLNEAVAVTDKKGNFVFSSLKPGTYYLIVEKGVLPLNKVASQKTPIIIRVTEKETTSIDIGITRAAKLTGKILLDTLGKTHIKGSNSLGTTKLNEAHIAGESNSIVGFTTEDKTANLKSQGLNNLLVELSNEGDLKRRVTDVAGRFSFEELYPGEWTLKVYNDNLPENHYLEKDTIKVDLIAGEKEEVLIKVLPKKRRIRMIQEGKNLVVEKKKTPNAASGKIGDRYHKVVSGDWLSNIAKEKYGDAKKYGKIFEANRDKIKDPDLIYPGQILRIPK